MRFKKDITHGRVLVISGSVSTKTFCPPMCFLFVYSESYFYTFGRIDWVGWRLAHGEDGRKIPYFLCKVSAIARHFDFDSPI